MKILHSGDLHLDSPLAGAPDLKQALLQVPNQLAQICREENCDLVLLSGDVFDGQPSFESLHLLKKALAEMAVPVLIAPGNHDFCTPDSPWLTEKWPENVHIFTKPVIESTALPELDCRVYGAGFDSMDCHALLDGFHAQGVEKYHIGILHGDPTLKNSPYNPITTAQVGASGLHYLALGHIHKGGSFRTKGTLCAWPGCPMGRGFDELGEKGVLLVTLEEKAEARFVPLDTPRFYDWETEILTDAQAAVAALLPPTESHDHYRITLVGEAEPVDPAAVMAAFPQFPHLQVKDRTVPPTDLWGSMGQDSLEGVYFGLLHDALETEDADTVQLAAKISRMLLDGREVTLP